eukprot:2814641-Rhodomonas_salina.3
MASTFAPGPTTERSSSGLPTRESSRAAFRRMSGRVVESGQSTASVLSRQIEASGYGCIFIPSCCVCTEVRRGGTSAVNSVAYDATNMKLLTTSEDRSVKMWLRVYTKKQGCLQGRGQVRGERGGRQVRRGAARNQAEAAGGAEAQGEGGGARGRRAPLAAQAQGEGTLPADLALARACAHRSAEVEALTRASVEMAGAQAEDRRAAGAGRPGACCKAPLSILRVAMLHSMQLVCSCGDFWKLRCAAWCV